MSTIHQRKPSSAPPPVSPSHAAPSSPSQSQPSSNNNDNNGGSSPVAQSSPQSGKGKEKVVLLADEDKKKKWASWRVRFIWTWIMLFGFAFIFAMGHIPLMFFVLFIQVCMYREIVKLTIVPLKEKKLHGGWTALVWYWFVVALFFCYGQLSARYFGMTIPYHTFISFSLECLGVVVFVLMLKKGSYKYQFVMFAWCQLTLLLVVVQSTFLIVNMFQGLIWFILPALLIISNDIWAYFWGFFFGKTPLIKLSPKKTWEGFVGGAIMTLLTGFFLSRVLSQFDLMICGKTDFSMAYPHCVASTPFLVASSYDWPAPVAAALKAIDAIPGANIITKALTFIGVNPTSIDVSPMQFHGIVIGLFASFLAPFGGFFASGFKRAFKIKDFGDTIPGHGGFTDRMDCQIMMSLFAYVYYWTFVVPRQEGEYVLQQFSRLSGEDKLRIWQRISDQVAPLLKQ